MKGTLSTAARAAAGRLEGIEPLELVRDLCRARATGVLRVRRGDVEKSLYLDDGAVIFAASTDPDDRLGVRLLQRRRVRVDQVDRAVTRLDSGRRIGSLLVEDGSLGQDDLELGVREQTREIALSLFAWGRGAYRFEEGPLPTEESIRLEESIDALLLDGVRRIASFGRLRRGVGGPRARFRACDSADLEAAALPLREGEEQVLRALRERERSAEELCRDLVLSSFEVLQALLAFHLLDWIEPAEQIGWSDDGTLRGAEPGQDFATFFVDVCASGQTGVLEAGRDRVTRAFHISDGRCLFASSDDEDDRLVHYLMRRGVITLQDGEEVNRRMLTNKRVGTILLELGAIDRRDLEDMVRQQVTEIVCDTFRRGAVEMRFLPGPLPHQEEIELSAATPALVTAGIRRVQSWNRIEAGCGGLDTPLSLAPDYLDILDAMRAGEEEWEVVTALKTMRTPADLCAGSRLGGFRVCQILWTLRLLGAVRPTEAADSTKNAAAAQVAAGADEASFEDVAVYPDPNAGADPGGDVGVHADPGERPVPESGIGESGRYEEEDRDLLQTASAIAADPPSAAELDDVPIVDPLDDDPSEIEGPGATMRLDRGQVEEMLRRAAAAPPDTMEAEGPIDADDRIQAQEAAAEESSRLPEPPPDATQQLTREQIAAALRGQPPCAPAPQTDRSPTEADDSASQTQQIEREALGGPDDWRDRAPDAPPSGISPDATQQLSREQIEGALREEAAPGSERDDDPTAEAERDRVDEIDATAGDEETDAPPAEGSTDADAPTPGTDDPACVAGEADGAERGEAAEPEDADAREIEPIWVAPVDLEEAIAEFNDRQRVVFRTARIEIGAGAVNFIRSSCAETGRPGPIAEVEFRPDGSWDADGLRDAARAAGLSDPRSTYRGMIEAQIAALEPLVGRDRCERLRRHVDAVGL